ncbi:hypothetical protein WS67_03555 [Burkholderia singularis]|uniref:Uncharacterized protein n=1 Tax=Burkholderia singularis TaxID=1503053 RepID=A0A118DQN3_9BURK|nr:hypothetical protein [Burkholderia sp. MSMB175]AOK32493.1 hypothetical protein AQ611_24110 [Burkholderia sp. Bp7605]KVE29959.1 hypothetical protein WS67_03555 [Burkholderia singularis]
MKKVISGIALVAVVGWLAATTTVLHAPSERPCTDAWFDQVDQQLAITDDAGHGPDPGSSEWLSATERRMQLPANDQLTTQARCDAIQHALASRTTIVNRHLGLKFTL